MDNLPGPKDWGVWTVTLVYTFELAYIAGIALLSAEMFIAIVPLGLNVNLLGVIIVIFVACTLLCRPLGFVEKIAYLIVGGALCLVIYCTVAAMLGPATEISTFSSLDFDVFQVIGSGSGLSLLLYSIYVNDRVKKAEGEGTRDVMKGIRRGLLVAFTLTGIILFGIAAVAAASGQGDLPKTVADGLASLPLASSLFIFLIFFLMFGIVLLGVDGGARAISKMLRQNGSGTERRVLYRRLVVVFTIVIIVTLWLGRPEDVLSIISAISSALFALTGFVLVYLNWKMPREVRAGLLWVTVTLMGSTIFLAVALINEETMLQFGLPMLTRVVVIALLLYLLDRLKVLGWMIDNARYWGGAAGTLVLFSLVSIFGTVGGVRFGGVIINFRDMGAIIAGLLGGPVVGGLVGLVGGAYRYGLGGWTALACFVATVSAGIVSGLASCYWKGRVSYLKVMMLGTLVEAMHLLLYFPLLTFGASTAEITETIRFTIVPMTITNVLGLLAFVYVIDLKRSTLRPGFAILRKPC